MMITILRGLFTPGQEFGNFVFVCCEENENKSNFIAALDAYRIRQFEKNTQTGRLLRNNLRCESSSHPTADLKG